MDPHKGEDALQKIDHWIRDEGFADVAVDPIHARIAASDERYLPIYERCCALEVPVIITAGPARYVEHTLLDHGHPRHIDAIAQMFPSLQIVVSHGAWPYVNEMIGVVYRNHNVYIEMSEYEQFPQSNAYITAGNTMIGDKIIFASAHPAVDYKAAIALYQELPWEHDVRENIMWKNAARLLKLDTID